MNRKQFIFNLFFTSNDDNFMYPLAGVVVKTPDGEVVRYEPESNAFLCRGEQGYEEVEVTDQLLNHFTSVYMKIDLPNC